MVARLPKNLDSKSPAFGGFLVLKHKGGVRKVYRFFFGRVFRKYQRPIDRSGLDEPLRIDSVKVVHLSYIAWRQLELQIQLICDECPGRSRVIRVVCHGPQRVNLDEDCLFCGRPLSGEVIFL